MSFDNFDFKSLDGRAEKSLTENERAALSFLTGNNRRIGIPYAVLGPRDQQVVYIGADSILKAKEGFNHELDA